MSSMSAPLASQFKGVSTVQALSKRFDPVIIQAPETDTSISNFDYVSKMNIERNVDLDSGSTVRYDVQPDTRFLKNYIEQNISAMYPELNIKGHPLVSLPSLAGYDFTLFYAFLLGCDIHHRSGMSYWAKQFYTDSKKKELYNELLNCHVPSYMTEFLLTLAPVYDPRRTDHLLVPSLAGYSHLHDFGRTIPPSVYTLAHHKLASTSSRKEPADYQAEIYDLNVLNFNRRSFKIGNYFGSNLSDSVTHNNWVNEDFESFLNPVLGRTLVQRPTLGKLVHHTPSYASQRALDTYEFFLMAQENNIENTLKFVRALSQFTLVQDPKSPLLGNVLASLSGALLFSHSIEPITLPTHIGVDKLPKIKVTSGSLPDPVDDSTWATSTNFLIGHKPHAASLAWLKDDTNLVKKLYLLVKQKFDPASNPIKYVLFSESEHTAPYVLHFQPFDVTPSSIALHVIAGLKIELAELDGIMIPLPDASNSLDDNNSQYLQSAVRLHQVKPLFSNAAAANDHTRVWQRHGVNKEQQGSVLAFRNHMQNQLPQLANEDINATIGTTNLDDVGAFDDIRLAANLRGTKNGIITHSDSILVNCWSSYRIVHKFAKPDTSDISMITSLRHIYGLNVTLSRSKAPSSLIPH